MYTRTQDERDRLYKIMAEGIMPALGRAVAEVARDAVYEIEGFHPDISYGDNMAAAADEITVMLCDYFAGLSYRREGGLYAQLTPEALAGWLAQRASLK